MILTLTILLFLCGIAGFILNRNNVILLIVAIELLLLAVVCIFNSSFNNTRLTELALFPFYNITTTYSYEATILFTNTNNSQPNLYIYFFFI